MLVSSKRWHHHGPCGPAPLQLPLQRLEQHLESAEPPFPKREREIKSSTAHMNITPHLSHNDV